MSSIESQRKRAARRVDTGMASRMQKRSDPSMSSVSEIVDLDSGNVGLLGQNGSLLFEPDFEQRMTSILM